ncbi:MAG: magnesium transporter [Candidatus Riflebacteria bacterium]|nr:magnesium transporter [Candidatus Riflebacteria bacterium]
MDVTETPDLKQLLESRNTKELHSALTKMKAVDIALFLDDLEIKDVAFIFRVLPKVLSAKVYAYLPLEKQTALTTLYTESETIDLLDRLYMDDLADVLEELPANLVGKILKNATPEKREVLNMLLQYSDDSAGSIMTVEYVHFRKTMKVRDAIKKLRQSGETTETIYTCFVTDKNRYLEGTVSIQALLSASDDTFIDNIMDKSPISASTSDDREEVAKLFQKYDFTSMAVVDNENRLVGIITIDDIFDVLTEEITEDIAKMSAVSPSETPYLKTPVLVHVKNRIPWLLFLMVSGMISGFILQRYQKVFELVPILVSFIPMLTDTGGNAGSQSSGLLIRGISLDEVGIKDILTVIWKELRIGFLVGIALTLINYFRLYFTIDQNSAKIALTVSLAMIATVMMAKVMGGILPLLAKKIGLDPAIMSAPLITTTVDAASLVIFFNIAKIILV